jgi:hypothetical protein
MRKSLNIMRGARLAFVGALCVPIIICPPGQAMGAVGASPGLTQDIEMEDVRHPVPAQEDLEMVTARVQKLYSKELQAKNKETRRNFADQLFQLALESEAPAEEWVLSRYCLDLREALCQFAQADMVIDELVASFRLDPNDEALQSIRRVAEMTLSTEETIEHCNRCFSLAGRLTETGFSEMSYLALMATEVPIAKLRTRGQTESADSLKLQRKTVQDRLDLIAAVAKARQTLEVSPNDPGANLVLGAYLAFDCGELAEGLAYLAHASDELLREIAVMELDGAKIESMPDGGNPVEHCCALAERWWTWGVGQQTKSRQFAALERARDLFGRAKADAKGIRTGEIEKRIEALEAVIRKNGFGASDLDASRSVFRGASVPLRLERAITSGLSWLALHQSPDGCWHADDFAGNCEAEGGLANGNGDPKHDIGVTALAVLAFLCSGGASASLQQGDLERVTRAKNWMLDQQDEQGCFRVEEVSDQYLYDHIIATWALAEYQLRQPDSDTLSSLQLAVEFLLREQNSGRGWRGYVTADQTNDTSVTGWAVHALAAAKEVGVPVSNDCFSGALNWLNEATDPNTGRTGYYDQGGDSARSSGDLERFPANLTAAMTASALAARACIRAALGPEWKLDPSLRKMGIDRILQCLPVWDPSGGGGGDSGWQPGDPGKSNDMYYWFWGTLALHRLKDFPSWRPWKTALLEIAIENQRTAPPCFKGSWDPGGPWGSIGGRIYSTALMVLILKEMSF